MRLVFPPDVAVSHFVGSVPQCSRAPARNPVVARVWRWNHLSGILLPLRRPQTVEPLRQWVLVKDRTSDGEVGACDPACADRVGVSCEERTWELEACSFEAEASGRETWLSLWQGCEFACGTHGSAIV